MSSRLYELRHCLCSTPILAYPDFSRQFTLDTDASEVGIGAVLSQIDDEGRERVIAYGSRALTRAERRYCVTRKELLAVVVFTRQYRHYLTGKKFMHPTDHGSLSWLRNFKDPEGQLARWLERLQELDFDVIHRRGKIHTNADALSHLPCQQCGRSSHVKSSTATITTTSISQPLRSESDKNIRTLQLADPVLGPLLRSKESGALEQLGCVSRPSHRLLQIWEQLIVSEGILCCQSPDGSSAVAQIVIPTTLREEVPSSRYNGRHFGIDKTRLKEPWTSWVHSLSHLLETRIF